MAEELVHWPDLGANGYLVRATPDDYNLHFKIYQLAAKGPPFWVEVEGADNSTDTTDDLEKAQVYVSGFLRPDGCINFTFDEQEHGMLHGCGRRDVEDLGRVLGRLYDLAPRMIPKWYGKTD